VNGITNKNPYIFLKQPLTTENIGHVKACFLSSILRCTLYHSLYSPGDRNAVLIENRDNLVGSGGFKAQFLEPI
jgi:hypothetical protein